MLRSLNAEVTGNPHSLTFISTTFPDAQISKRVSGFILLLLLGRSCHRSLYSWKEFPSIHTLCSVPASLFAVKRLSVSSASQCGIKNSVGHWAMRLPFSLTWRISKLNKGSICLSKALKTGSKATDVFGWSNVQRICARATWYLIWTAPGCSNDPKPYTTSDFAFCAPEDSSMGSREV